MMKRQILDCTLRDGGYLTEKHFNENIVRGIINGLTEAAIDYVEIGFLQDDVNPHENVAYQNSKDARKFIPDNRKNTLYTVLADYSRYSVSNLDPYDGQSFDAVRVCFFKRERKDITSFAREVIAKGYKLFVQPVDILGYSDIELIDLISDVNLIKPDGFAIVDTFGSMYMDDLHTVFSIIHHNLNPNIAIDFHSHNNLQMSSALSQEFLNISQNKRDAVVDSTIMGIGRGAGNAPTELIVQYANDKMNGKYHLDTILDLIDSYIMGIKAQFKWGYDISMFLAGCFSSHVNNVDYLLKKPSLCSKDIRFILNSVDAAQRKRYDYNNLEALYLEYLKSNIDDSNAMEILSNAVSGKKILVVAPGKSVGTEKAAIQSFIKRHNPIVIAVNFLPDMFPFDYVYFSNRHRYDFWKYDDRLKNIKKIITSNISSTDEENDLTISFLRLVKSGWNNLDNSVIMLLRLLDGLSVNIIALAGFDGFSAEGGSYFSQDFENETNPKECLQKNAEIEDMFFNFLQNKKVKKVFFITQSRFDKTAGLSDMDSLEGDT